MPDDINHYKKLNAIKEPKYIKKTSENTTLKVYDNEAHTVK